MFLVTKMLTAGSALHAFNLFVHWVEKIVVEHWEFILMFFRSFVRVV